MDSKSDTREIQGIGADVIWILRRRADRKISTADLIDRLDQVINVRPPQCLHQVADAIWELLRESQPIEVCLEVLSELAGFERVYTVDDVEIVGVVTLFHFRRFERGLVTAFQCVDGILSSVCDRRDGGQT